MVIFSVVIPVLNEERFVSRLIDSLIHQDFPRKSFEIIVVDNGSVDSSMSILTQYETQIRIFSEKTRSSYAARNKGVAESRGQYIAFTDGDCEVSKSWLSNAYEFIQETGAEVVQGKVIFNSNARSIRFLEDYEDYKHRFVFSHQNSLYLFAHTNNLFIKKEVFDRIGLFGVALRGMDSEFMHRYVADSRSQPPIYVEKLEVRHLEIQSVYDWAKKMRLYAETSAHLERVSQYRVLGLSQRLLIVWNCWKGKGYSFLEKVFFVGVIISVWLSFECRKMLFENDRLARRGNDFLN